MSREVVFANTGKPRSAASTKVLEAAMGANAGRAVVALAD